MNEYNNLYTQDKMIIHVFDRITCTIKGKNKKKAGYVKSMWFTQMFEYNDSDRKTFIDRLDKTYDIQKIKDT